MNRYDLIIKNGHVVIPRVGTLKTDLGVFQGKIASIAKDIDPNI